MTTTHPTLDLPIEGRSVVASSRRQELTRLALIIPTMLMAAAIAVSLEGSAMYVAFGVMFCFALVGAWVVQSAAVHADTVVLVGRGPMAAIIANSLESGGRRNGNPLRVMRAQSLVDASVLVKSSRCDEVILAGPVDTNLPELTDARGLHPTMVMGSDAIEQVLGRVPMELVAQDRWFANLGPIRRLKPSYTTPKRLLDIFCALTLAILALPVIILAAIAIRLDSPGPVIFRQQRMGLGGNPFEIWKFRTMRQAPERPAQTDGDWTKEVWTQQSDPRITRIGKFMRASRIDELPQLWNVLNGEMTFVGPRPEWTKSTAMLEQVLPEYPKRYAVKPGITGWAQVRYRYTNSIDGQRRKLEYDLYYVKHASLRMDIGIMIKTAMTILRLKGL